MNKYVRCIVGAKALQLVRALVQASFVLLILFSSSLFSQVPVLYVDGWDYAYGSRGYAVDGVTEIIITENLDPEEVNHLYPNNPMVGADRECTVGCGLDDEWSNKGDVGEERLGSGCHCGGDQNKGSGTDDAGEELFAPANGQVVAIFSVNNAGPQSFGWLMVLKHYYLDGSHKHSVLKHITTLDSTSGGICLVVDAFTVAVGDWVVRGQPIARIATGFTNPGNDTHLHFEIRDSNFDFVVGSGINGLYPRDNGKQNYGGLVDCVTPCANSGVHMAMPMTEAQVAIAYANMQRDGIVDPEDFIEQNRPSTYTQIAPEITWQNTIGGSEQDGMLYVKAIQTSDGGYIVGGSSYSVISGDKTEDCQGLLDYWVVKLNNSGDIEWQNTIGGSDFDELYSTTQTLDGGYIIGGSSHSNISGDKTENSFGQSDYWILKLNSFGDIEWQKTIGGSDWDLISNISQTFDGGYIVGGHSQSPISGYKTHSCFGILDYWILKLNSIGDIEWQKTIGGSNTDLLTYISQTSDAGYILTGYSRSGVSGSKTEPTYGDYDNWIIKLDSVGSIEWQNTIGGSLYDRTSVALQDIDGGYIVAGTSLSSVSFDKAEESNGGYDYWVIKLNSLGSIEWQNTIGGISGEIQTDLSLSIEGGYIIGGYSQSGISGDKDELCQGIDDYWVVKLNNSGDIEWQNTIGGSGIDQLFGVSQSQDEGYILSGISYSGISGDKTEESLYGDFWIVKLGGNCIPSTEICNSIDDDCDGLIDEGFSVSVTIEPFGPTSFCQGSSIVLGATYTGVSVQWYKNGISITGATSSTLNVNTSGSYTCETTNECASAMSAPIAIIVNKNPPAAITAGGATTFCAGGSVVLTANAGGGLSYQWYKGAFPIVGATSINYTATTSGNYKCRVIKTATGCFKNSNAISVSVTCKEEEKTDVIIDVFPNPTLGIVYISLSKQENIFVTVTDMLGRVVIEEQYSNSDIEFDLGNIAKGSYLITVTATTFVHSVFIMKE